MEPKATVRRGSAAERLFQSMMVRLGMASLLVVPGRRTGTPRAATVMPIEIDGRRYLLSTLGLSEWSRNLRAAGRGVLRRGGRVEEIQAVEVQGVEHELVVAEFHRTRPSFVKKQYDRLPDPANHPAFRLEPIGGALG
jgi:deazaflavin-dependent oxidoreductase (nitroreductase family)